MFGVDTPTSFAGLIETSGGKAMEAAGMATSAATGDSIAMLRQAKAMAGKAKKPISQQNAEMFDMLEKVIRGDKQ